MANEEQQPRGDQEGLREDPIVEKLVPDPSQPPDPAVVLVGLLGRSPTEGYWRLYFSSELNHYAQFKEEDLLNSEKIPQEQPPFAGLEATRVWIRRGAEIAYTRTESRRVQAEFLQGGLAEGFRAGAAGTFGAARPLQPRVDLPSRFVCGSFRICPSWVDDCPSAFVPCPPRTQVEACVSGIVACSAFCPSVAQAGCGSGIVACSRFCPSEVAALCGSLVDDCPSGFCPPSAICQ